MLFSCLENFSECSQNVESCQVFIKIERSLICSVGIFLASEWAILVWFIIPKSEYVTIQLSLFFSSMGSGFFPPPLFLFILTYRFVMLMIGSTYKITDYTFWYFSFLKKYHWQHHIYRCMCIFLHFSLCKGTFVHPREAYTSGFVDVLNAAFSSIISAFIYLRNKEFPAQSAGLEYEQNNSLWFIGNRCTWGCLQGASRYY